MRKYCYLLSVLFVGIGAVSILAPSQAGTPSQAAKTTNWSDILDETDTGVVVSAPSQAQRVNRRVNRDYSYYIQRNIQASNLADDAMRGCYADKNLEECDKLIKIENVVSNWCGQGDVTACSTYSSINTLEIIKRNSYSN